MSESVDVLWLVHHAVFVQHVATERTERRCVSESIDGSTNGGGVCQKVLIAVQRAVVCVRKTGFGFDFCLSVPDFATQYRLQVDGNDLLEYDLSGRYSCQDDAIVTHGNMTSPDDIGLTLW